MKANLRKIIVLQKLDPQTVITILNNQGEHLVSALFRRQYGEMLNGWRVDFERIVAHLELSNEIDPDADVPALVATYENALTLINRCLQSTAD